MRSKWIILNIKLCLFIMIVLSWQAVTAFCGTFLDISAEDSEKVEIVSDLGFLYYDLVPYFSPEKILTRKEAAEIMYVLHNGYFYNDGKTNFVSSYTDAYKNDYVINFCRENGFIRGYPDNSFKPNNPVTHAEIIEMFVKTLGFEKDRILEFPDEYLSVASEIGLLNGVDFDPDSYVTNLSAAKLVFNALTLPLYPVIGKQNLLETRFASLYKTVLETNDRIERMLVLLEDVDGMDIDLINADFAMINECYKQLASINVNCEFKFNHKMQFMRKMNGFMNLIAELKIELVEIDNSTVYGDFERYNLILGELEVYDEMSSMSTNYDKYWEDIHNNAVLNIFNLYKSMSLSISQRLPNMEYFVRDFASLESNVIDALLSNVIDEQVPVDFYNESNWIMALINQYTKSEQIYNFVSDRGLMDDDSYYGKLLEITYIIRSIYYIKGCEYSMTTESDIEKNLASEYFSAIRELRDEISRVQFVYYQAHADKLIEKFDELLEIYSV